MSVPAPAKSPVKPKLIAKALFAFAILFGTSQSAFALAPSDVVVLYNSKGQDSNGSGQSDSVDIFQYYQSARPGVLGFDLNDASLTPGNISYPDYISKIRDPLRSHLTDNNLESVSVFTLTRGIPHRIEDINSANLGDQPGNATEAVEAGNATYATVDSELTVLWQPLELNEANGTLDSFADNIIQNPYHNSSAALSVFNRNEINEEKSFQNIGTAAWRMRESPNGRQTGAGSIYLTSRLDGHSVSDVVGMIDRGRYPSYNQFEDLLLFDENTEGVLDNAPLFMESTLGHLGDDYDESAAEFGAIYDKVLLNENGLFLIGPNPFAGSANTEVVTDDIALLSSYGGNHGGNATGFVQSFNYSNGAIMNTLESYNAKQLGGVGGFNDQGQLADFVAAGGTFGIGQSWEPFAFSLPDNESLLDNFVFGDLTWVESAWTAIPWLSWQQVVFGDPLAEATLIEDPQTIVWQGSNAASGFAGDGMTWGNVNNWVRDGVVDTGFQHGDSVIFAGENTGPVTLGEPRIVQSILFAGRDFVLRGDDLAIRTGQINVNAGVTAEIESDIYTANALSKIGDGVLQITGNAPRTVVNAGTLGGTGTIANLEVAAGRLRPGSDSDIGALIVDGDYIQRSGSRLSISLNGRTSSSLNVSGLADLEGSLDLLPLDGHTEPTIRGSETQFTILTAGSLVGGFDAIIYNGQPLELVSTTDADLLVGHVDDGLFQIVDHGNVVRVTSYLAIPGDANGDQVVDATDFAIWSSNRFNSGTDWTSGDFNNDGLTDVADFNIWNANFGTVGASAVPEPSTSWGLVIGVFCLAAGLRRRHHS